MTDGTDELEEETDAELEAEPTPRPPPERLGGKKYKLVAPASHALVNDLVNAMGNNAERALCAALGVCCRGPGRAPIRYDDHGYNPLRYGGAVFDWYVSRGVPAADVIAAGEAAWRLIRDGLVTEAEKREAGNGSAGEAAASAK